jgi:hypothetical protein
MASGHCSSNLDTAIQRLTLDRPDQSRGAVQLTSVYHNQLRRWARRLSAARNLRRARKSARVRHHTRNGIETATESGKSLEPRVRTPDAARLASARRHARRRHPSSTLDHWRSPVRADLGTAAGMAALALAGAARCERDRLALQRHRATVACLTLGFWVSSVVLMSSALDRARHPSLRQFLEREFGGFEISTLGPEAVHDPILARAVLIEDASPARAMSRFT